jgi:hypothetical protein
LRAVAGDVGDRQEGHDAGRAGVIFTTRLRSARGTGLGLHRRTALSIPSRDDCERANIARSTSRLEPA